MSFSMERFMRCAEVCVVDETARQELLVGCEAYADCTTPVQKAAFIKQLLARFEQVADQAAIMATLEQCGRGCLGASLGPRARALRTDAADLEAWIARLNEQHIGGGRLRLEGQQIHVQYERCYCGSVSKGKQMPFSTCYCSAGWLKALFEQALETPVTVEIVQTVLRGGPTCDFLITPASGA